jgi:hypothetical protein
VPYRHFLARFRLHLLLLEQCILFPPLFLPLSLLCTCLHVFHVLMTLAETLQFAHLNSVQNCALDGVQTSCTVRICIVLPHFISHVLSCLCAQMLGRFSVSNAEHWQGIMVGPCLWYFISCVSLVSLLSTLNITWSFIVCTHSTT